MDKLVIYCKSYNKDVYLAKRLLDSIIKYNEDKLKFYISVPSSDRLIFEEVLGIEGYTLIDDEEIDTENNGHQGQQIVKSQFWKLGVCENYISIDSDCFFIKPFYTHDFMFNEDTPYTICHEYKHFFEFLQKHPYIKDDQPMNFDPYKSFVEEREYVMNLFDRKGVVYDFGPGPTIWSCKVWKSLQDNYITPHNLQFADLIKSNPSEFTWYGEWLLHKQDIQLMPKGPIFKNYHYPYFYQYDKSLNYDEEKIKKLYLGIGMQSIYNFNEL